MVALEALSAGLPVCASDRVVGLPDTVQTAAYNDIEAWVEVVSGILRHPPEAKLLMASVANYSVDEVQQRWKTLYELLCSNSLSFT
jgi:glycosyltransferase involved in cell wall biosynthesis